MRHLLAAALLLLPTHAHAQEADLHINPLTSYPRSAFDPITSDEVGARMGDCLAREIGGSSEVEAAARSCEADALDFCARVTAEYPMARDQCALSVQLAWGDLRYKAGQAVVDALYAPLNGTTSDTAVRAEAEAFSADDDSWRAKRAEACRRDGEDELVACETTVERDRAVLYYTRLAEMGSSP